MSGVGCRGSTGELLPLGGCPTHFTHVQVHTLRDQRPAEGIAIGHSAAADRLQCIMFADDLTLLASSKEGAQHMLDTLHRYATAKGLTVNVGKTEVMVYGEQLARQRITRTLYTYGPSAAHSCMQP